MTSAGALGRLAEEAMAAGRSAGLDAVGVASAAPFDDVHRTLVARAQAGLDGGMAFTYRIPARSTDPGRTVPGARALVVGARSYRRAAHGRVASPPVGTVARYAWGDSYAPLREALEAAADRIRQAGYTARVLVDDNALVDRAAAHRAGIGWFGKNSNLLLPGLGSWFVLGSVVTDAPLPRTANEPLRTEDGCGPCDRCRPACPTGALVAPGVLDARRCLAWLLQAPGDFPIEHRAALGDRIYGCDDCQTVCPPNRAAELRTPSPVAGPGDEPQVSLLDVLEATDDELLARHGRWYIPRRDPRFLRRNALVALGNVADGRMPRVVSTVRRYLAMPDPLLQRHAAWAAVQMGRADLVAQVAEEVAGVSASPAP